jgi:hypothetical protein
MHSASSVPSSRTLPPPSAGTSAAALVQIVGLRPQLTVPSRGDAGTVDLWFDAAWGALPEEWEDTLRQIAAERLVGDDRPVREVAGLAVSATRGFVVARGVRDAAANIDRVESLMRDVVAATNQRCARSAVEPVRRPSRFWLANLLVMLVGSSVG